MPRLFTIIILALVCCAACTQGPQQERELRRAAGEAYASGRFLEAEKMYERYLQDWPKGPGREDAWKHLLSISLDITRDHAKAANILEAMVLELGDKPDTVFNLLVKMADVYGQGLGRWDKAIQSLERCRTITGIDAARMLDVETRLAAGYRSLGRYSQALDALNKAQTLAADPAAHQRVDYDKAQVLVYLKRLDQAEPLFKALTQSAEPELKTLATYALADLYEQQGKPDKALPLLESIKSTYPNPEAVKVKIDLLRGKGQKAKE